MSVPPFVTADELRAALGFAELIEPVAEAFRRSSAGEAQNGLIVLFPGNDAAAGDVYVKSGVLSGAPLFIVKVAPWFAANTRTGMPQGGFVAVFDSATGHTRAILADEHYLSDIRTAAAGAIAARLFAPARVGTAAVLGAGVQAYWQSLALFHERSFERLLIWARDTAKADRLIERLREKLPSVDIAVAQSVEQAVRAADVLITATLSREPLVRGAWLRPGQHITAVGADDATKCELDADVLRRAVVFVDDRATAESNGDVYAAIQDGGDRAGLIDGEIGEVLTKRIDGRTSDEQITVAKLIGIGAQDVAAAAASIKALNL